MVRVLSIGSQLDFADYVDWDDTVNIRDYDIVFINLRDLERRKDEFVHENVPEEYKRMYEMPPSDHIVQLLVSGGDLIITLPNTLQNDLSWLPFAVETHEDGGESIAEDTIDDDWDWYFPNAFSWEISFTKGPYEDGRHQFKIVPLVKNRYGQALAAKVVVNRMRGKRTIEARPNWGTIYLLPMLDGWGIDQLAEKMIQHQYPEIDIETVGKSPDWLSDYDAPREDELEEQIKELQQELAEVQSLKRLLWEQGDELEEAVYDAFRKAGLTIQEEVPHRRDGAIDLGDRMIMLEITGTTGSVTERKLSQLNKWVINNQDKFEEEVAGLFVINYSRDTDPVDRRLHLDPDRMEYLENSGLQLVTTLDLFTMVHGLESQDVDGNVVEAKLRSGVEIIKFESVEGPL